MNRNQARSGGDFVTIFRESHNLSTNWSYANDHEIAYVHGGLYPERPRTRGPRPARCGARASGSGRPTAGSDVFLGRSQVPHEVAPARDYFVSWNNRPAPGWGSADAQWGHSSIYRADLLEDAILGEQPRSIDPVRLVQMMEQAGLTDLRGRYVAAAGAARCCAARRGVGRARAEDDRAAARVDRRRRAAARRRRRRRLRPVGRRGDHGRLVGEADPGGVRPGDRRRLAHPAAVRQRARAPAAAPTRTASTATSGPTCDMVLGEQGAVARPHGSTAAAPPRRAARLDECAKRVLASLVAAGDAAGRRRPDPPGRRTPRPSASASCPAPRSRCTG